jgi:hypothetical protein
MVFVNKVVKEFFAQCRVGLSLEELDAGFECLDAHQLGSQHALVVQVLADALTSHSFALAQRIHGICDYWLVPGVCSSGGWWWWWLVLCLSCGLVAMCLSACLHVCTCALTSVTIAPF